MYLIHCVSFIHSRFLGNIKEAFEKNPDLKNLLLDDFFKQAILKCQVSQSYINSIIYVIVIEYAQGLLLKYNP